MKDWENPHHFFIIKHHSLVACYIKQLPNKVEPGILKARADANPNKPTYEHTNLQIWTKAA